jgi:hypothetical protein
VAIPRSMIAATINLLLDNIRLGNEISELIHA